MKVHYLDCENEAILDPYRRVAVCGWETLGPSYKDWHDTSSRFAIEREDVTCKKCLAVLVSEDG